MSKVKVVSTLRNKVSVNVPDLRFSRAWPAAGASVSIEKETLEELMYDVGFKNMIESGILYIEDMPTKIELGLEPEDATEPVNIIVLSDRDKRYYLTQLSLVGFKDKVKKLSRAQLEELCDYAIQNRLIDIEKDEILQQVCGRDIVNAVRLEKQNQEG